MFIPPNSFMPLHYTIFAFPLPAEKEIKLEMQPAMYRCNAAFRASPSPPQDLRGALSGQIYLLYSTIAVSLITAPNPLPVAVGRIPLCP